MRDYLQDKREGERKKKRRKIQFVLFFIILLIGIGIFLFLVYKGVFSFHTITVEGNKQITTSLITTTVESFLEEQTSPFSLLTDDTHLYFFSSQRLSDHILASLPYLSQATIQKNITDKVLHITVSERDTYGLLCPTQEEQRSCWWFDSTGVIFLDGVHSEGQLVRTIQMSDISPSILDTFLSKDHFNVIQETFTFLEDISWPSRTIVIEESVFEEGYIPQTKTSPALHISLRHSPTFATNVIQELHKTNLEYIDLRIKNRVFYK